MRLAAAVGDTEGKEHAGAALEESDAGGSEERRGAAGDEGGNRRAGGVRATGGEAGGEADGGEDVPFPHVLAHLGQGFSDVVTGTVGREEVAVADDGREVLPMHADGRAEIDAIGLREVGEKPLQTLHLYLFGLLDVEITEHRNTDGSRIPAVCVTTDDFLAPGAPFINLPAFIDDVVVADVAPAATVGVVRVESADALYGRPLVASDILCSMVDDEEFHRW